MKYLFVSLDGLIADIAWTVVREGHASDRLEDDRAFGRQELKNAEEDSDRLHSWDYLRE